jgi:D-xylose transport system substrate-binding protein
MTSPAFRLAGAAIACTLALTSMAACSSNKPSSSSGGTASGAKKIALLLPESKTTRYESLDRPLFTAALKKACASCTLIYSNADQDASKQQQQAEAALTQGADVLVLDPVDGKAAASIVNSAKAQNVPVVAYDRLITNANYYVSFDLQTVGKLQAQTLVDLIKKGSKSTGSIVMINGAPTDPNAAEFKKGAHSVLDKSGFKVAAEFDTPDWSPDKAQGFMEGQLSAIKSGLVGVYAANDGTAGGAIAALKGGGVKPLPPVTGQDAELAGIQRVVSGDQGMTVYKPVTPQATDAANAAVALANGKKPASKTVVSGVPATILTPIAVTKGNIKDTVVKDGLYSIAKICSGSVAAACNAAGLK